MAIKSDDFGILICDIFKLDPKQVGGIDISIRPGSMFEIDVKIRPTMDQAKSFAAAIEDYVLKVSKE